MITRAVERPRAPHLSSALIACAFPIILLLGGRMLAIYLEKKTIHSTAPQDFSIKNRGLVFQRAAARQADILLLYGSSELTDPVHNRASDFFSSEPSGFQVCPVGSPGTTSLITLQKLGALRSELRGRRVAISLSPSWFLTPAVNPFAYAGNFSLPAASGLLFSNAIDWNLKSQIASRMLQFPNTLTKGVILQLAARCLASNHPLNRIVFIAIWPLGKLQNAILELQDHFEALIYILGRGKGGPRLESLNLHKAPPTDKRSVHTNGSRSAWSLGQAPRFLGPTDPIRDAAFRARIATASEWIDLELLLRTLEKLEAHPLILSLPIDGTLYDTKGVSRSTRQAYYDKLSELAGRYHFPLIEFEDHDADPGFLIAHREHPTPRGWQYYNRALDDFFHKP